MTRVWTPEMDSKLAILWPSHGPSWDGWDEALGRHFTPSALYTRANKLGIPHRKRGARPYSDDEERELERLLDWYCERHGRSLGSVVRKASAIYERRRMRSVRERGSGGTAGA